MRSNGLTINKIVKHYTLKTRDNDSVNISISTVSESRQQRSFEQRFHSLLSFSSKFLVGRYSGLNHRILELIDNQ